METVESVLPVAPETVAFVTEVTVETVPFVTSVELDMLVTAETRRSEHVCSKLTTSLVNETLKFHTLISQTRVCQYFLLKKCEKLSFFQQNISVYLVIKL